MEEIITEISLQARIAQIPAIRKPLTFGAFRSLSRVKWVPELHNIMMGRLTNLLRDLRNIYKLCKDDWTQAQRDEMIYTTRNALEGIWNELRDCAATIPPRPLHHADIKSLLCYFKQTLVSWTGKTLFESKNYIL